MSQFVRKSLSSVKYDNSCIESESSSSEEIESKLHQGDDIALIRFGTKEIEREAFRRGQEVK